MLLQVIFCFKKRIAVFSNRGMKHLEQLPKWQGTGNPDGSFWLFVNFPPMSCHEILKSCPFLLPLEKGPATCFIDVEGNPMRSANGFTENRGAFFFLYKSVGQNWYCSKSKGCLCQPVLAVNVFNLSVVPLEMLCKAPDVHQAPQIY